MITRRSALLAGAALPLASSLAPHALVSEAKAQAGAPLRIAPLDGATSFPFFVVRSPTKPEIGQRKVNGSGGGQPLNNKTTVVAATGHPGTGISDSILRAGNLGRD